MDGNTATGGEPFDFGLVVLQIGVGDDLDVGEAATVVEFQETKPALGVASRTDPALESCLAADGAFLPGVADGKFVHECGFRFQGIK